MKGLRHKELTALRGANIVQQRGFCQEESWGLVDQVESLAQSLILR